MEECNKAPALDVGGVKMTWGELLTEVRGMLPEETWDAAGGGRSDRPRATRSFVHSRSTSNHIRSFALDVQSHSFIRARRKRGGA